MGKLVSICVLAFLVVWSLAHADGAPSESKFARYGNIKVHYQTWGSGPKALVFVHSWTASAETWKRNIAEFPQYRVIAVDLPGHGRSDKPHIDYSTEYFARSIEAVVRDAKVEGPVLVGHSTMGALVIQQFYRLFPHTTRGLVFVDGLPWFDVMTTPLATREEWNEHVASLRANYHEAAVEEVEAMLSPIHDERLKADIRSTMLAAPDYVGLNALECMYDGALAEQKHITQRIAVPVLAIMAKSGPWGPAAETIVRSRSSALDYEIWSDAGHFPMLERPAEFNKALRLFISENNLL